MVKSTDSLKQSLAKLATNPKNDVLAYEDLCVRVSHLLHLFFFSLLLALAGQIALLPHETWFSRCIGNGAKSRAP